MMTMMEMAMEIRVIPSTHVAEHLEDMSRTIPTVMTPM